MQNNETMHFHTRNISLRSTDSTSVSISSGSDFELESKKSVLSGLKDAVNKPISPRKLTTSNSRSSSTDSRKSYSLISRGKQKVVGTTPKINIIKTKPFECKNVGNQTQRNISGNKMY